MVQGKKTFNNSKPKFAEVVIGDSEAKEMRVAANGRPSRSLAKTEHSHPLGMVVSTHFRCGKGVKRGLKNGALPFNID